MFDNIAPFLSGGAGVGTGSLIMWLVLRERLSNVIVTQDLRDLVYNKRLDHHDREIEEIKERKHCGPCNELTIERRRYDEQQQKQHREDMAELKGEMVKVRETVNSCFEELVREMKRD